MFTFRTAITFAVMAFITALAGLLIFIQFWTLHLAAKEAASARMDSASATAVTTSQGKARAALLFGLPTGQVADMMKDGKAVSATLTPPVAGQWQLTIQRGGLPIIKGGKVVAAIGVGGSASANDEKFAQAGIDSMEK